MLGPGATPRQLYLGTEGEILKKFQQSKAMRKIAKEFEQDDALQLDIEFTGLELFKKRYSSIENESINELRHARYMNAIAGSFGSLQSARPEAFPPTESLHCQRVYLQVMACKHIESTSTVKAEEWGWKPERGKLTPVMTDREPAPADLLNVV